MSKTVLLVRVPTIWVNDKAMAQLAAEHLSTVRLPNDLNDPHENPADVVAVIMGDPPFPAEYLGRYPNLKVIARTGTGYNNIPVAAARARGIILTRVTEFAAEAVSEFALGLLLALTRNLVASHERVTHARKWELVKGPALSEMTVGIVGLGSIGRTLARKLYLLGVGRLLGWNRSSRREIAALARETGLASNTLPYVLTHSDAVVVCVALDKDTRHLLSRDMLSRLRSDAFLINVARGEVVDEEALTDIVAQGKIGGVALDVFSDEPPFENLSFQILASLIPNRNIILTSHQGGQTTHYGKAAPFKVVHDVLAALRGDLTDVEQVPQS